jgi:hypothetical protein
MIFLWDIGDSTVISVLQGFSNDVGNFYIEFSVLAENKERLWLYRTFPVLDCIFDFVIPDVVLL